ncbi:MAG TPA: tRNA pseudouridine synthase A [Acidobacteriaceae bacterium]|jgi:tRNA pseudouridine38-40 synthase|nr:tRNA pseudouridine synthase A [Acidobacteriaceae bacterium]
MKENGEGRTWKLLLAYDGGDFHGWQIQPDTPTVQGELRAAIARITGEEVLPQGSGRTDAGVHALGQVASFMLSAPIPEANLLRALNRTLPASIRIRSAQVAPPGFHARHSALAKTYEYRIFHGDTCPPWLARYVYAVAHRLNWEAMQRAAPAIVGEHDFTSFAAVDPSLADRRSESSETGLGDNTVRPSFPTELGAERPLRDGNIRTVHRSEWTKRAATSAGIDLNFPEEGFGGAGELLIYRVEGNGFLHHMVRNLVGTFLEIGYDNRSEESLPKILAARDRAKAGPTAPARGLFLCRVEYPRA